MKTIDNRDFTLTETLDRLAVETVDRVGDLGVDGVEVAISSGNGLSVTVRGGACVCKNSIKTVCNGLIENGFRCCGSDAVAAHEKSFKGSA